VSVESAASIVGFIVLAVAELDNIWHNNHLEQSGESISTEVTPESLHDPKELRYFQKRVQ
jgi:hypothetical protein